MLIRTDDGLDDEQRSRFAADGFEMARARRCLSLLFQEVAKERIEE
ncbi:MAG TPA: hypothetical protein ACFCUC_16665 [Desulfobacterales bacterium]